MKSRKNNTQATKNFDAQLMTSCEDIHARLALFLTGETGSCLKDWKGKLSGAEQIALFGKKLFNPLTKIYIYSEAQLVRTYRSVCFGTDSEIVFSSTWAELA